jgi:hypothetical protein
MPKTTQKHRNKNKRVLHNVANIPSISEQISAYTGTAKEFTLTNMNANNEDSQCTVVQQSTENTDNKCATETPMEIESSNVQNIENIGINCLTKDVNNIMILEPPPVSLSRINHTKT